MSLNKEKNLKIWKDKSGSSYSVYPSTTYLTFDYWIYMVPQYKPESVLMLGYGGGTVAGLIRLLYGDVPITAVDIEPCENQYGVELIQADAEQFVRSCALTGRKFDTVIIDLFSTEKSCDPPAFVTKKEFIDNLAKICNYLIINSLHSDMSAYKGLKKMGINKPSESGVLIYYYEINKIPNLHPWRN